MTRQSPSHERGLRQVLPQSGTLWRLRGKRARAVLRGTYLQFCQ
jgi:hypothetical protein